MLKYFVLVEGCWVRTEKAEIHREERKSFLEVESHTKEDFKKREKEVESQNIPVRMDV